MKLSTIVAVASAIATHTVVAAPASTDSVSNLQERENNGANCKYNSHGGIFKIVTWGPWAKGDAWGRGLLDNLRGQCGWIGDWGYYYRSNGAGVASFNIPPAANKPKCVQDAIWLASGPTNVGIKCTPDLVL
ncbi:hypothetical protein ABW20_dc0103352 [Dactylellina cionopaga]|nr:hypothetical protein ABW20_dc0103352 [Dactylellina cionopaga]